MNILRKNSEGDYATRDGRLRFVFDPEGGYHQKGLWVVYDMTNGRPCDGFETLQECRKMAGNCPGRIRQRLAERLSEALGVDVPPDCLWVQRGICSQAVADMAKWGANVPVAGTQGVIIVFSWDTMTNCLRQGFTIRRDDTAAIEVSANG